MKQSFSGNGAFFWFFNSLCIEKYYDEIVYKKFEYQYLYSLLKVYAQSVTHHERHVNHMIPYPVKIIQIEDIVGR